MNLIEHEKEVAYQAFSMKEYKKATELFQLLLTNHQKEMDADTFQILSGDYAVALLFSGERQRAITLLRDTLEYFKQTGNRHREGLVHGNLGTAYELSKNYKLAETSFLEAIFALENTSAADERYWCMKSLAVVRIRQGKIRPAMWSFLDAMEAKPKMNFFEKIFQNFVRLAFPK